MFITEHEFILPQGYLDDDGTLHREGVMRLATAADEIVPLKDPRVQKNPSYLVIILLSRVVTRLGDVQSINTSTIENLFVGDLAYLQGMYNRINHGIASDADAESELVAAEDSDALGNEVAPLPR